MVMLIMSPHPVSTIIRAGGGEAEAGSCSGLKLRATYAGHSPALTPLCTFDPSLITKYISCGNCHHLYNIKHPNREGNKLVESEKEKFTVVSLFSFSDIEFEENRREIVSFRNH